MGAVSFIETMDHSSLSNITQEEFEKYAHYLTISKRKCRVLMDLGLEMLKKQSRTSPRRHRLAPLTILLLHRPALDPRHT